MPSHWSTDHQLRIFILGPMGGPDSVDSSCAEIQKAVRQILAEPEAAAILAASGASRVEVEIPHALVGADIINHVFHKIDTADLIIANFTPKDGPGGTASPNVFYEMGFVHSLGTPHIMLAQEDTKLPFYFRAAHVHSLKSFNTAEVDKTLRGPLLEFLRADTDANFRDNRISQFYGNMPVVNVSAVAGLATGYYTNMVERALREGGFITHYPEKLRHLIVCRPINVFHTFEEDHAAMKAQVNKELGIVLEKTTLEARSSVDRRGLGADFATDVIVDLPSTVYTLVKSPRFQSLATRIRAANPGIADWRSHPLLQQNSQQLLDSFDATLRYLIDMDDRVRASAISFCSVRELPARLRELGIG